jgi:3',5'-nucleoside bisphosphate phosphatase
MYYDLHIHSCLSPCADDDMTPANIAGMARLKGLGMISLTDHNTGGNLIAMDKAARENGLVFVPGVEATSREEVHILIYFASLSEALRFTRDLCDSLPETANRPELFGRQLLIGEDDQPAGELTKLLLQATPYSVDELALRAQAAGGVAVPAHINRDSFSIISNLGFLPPGLFKTVEITQGLPSPDIGDSCHILHSSDAHNLGSISEAVHSLSGVKTAKDLIALLR